MKQLFMLVMISFLANMAIAQSPVGKWKTIDDETGETKSIVWIYEAGNGKYYGKVTKIFTDPEAKCTACPKKDYRYNQPVMGMKLIRDLKKVGDTYKSGTILDPTKGKVYSCELWVADDGNLKVRGYLGPIYRTQTWIRVKE